MKTIKGQELCKENCAWCKGYKDCKEDVLELMEELELNDMNWIDSWMELKSKIQGDLNEK